MPTQEEVEKIYDSLDRATVGLDELITAAAVGDRIKMQDVIGQMSRDLGICKEALRVVRADPPVVQGSAAEAGMRRSRMIRYAAAVRSKAQDLMVTVAAASLALSVTFGTTWLGSLPKASWLLRVSWIALATCVACVITE